MLVSWVALSLGRLAAWSLDRLVAQKCDHFVKFASQSLGRSTPRSVAPLGVVRAGRGTSDHKRSVAHYLDRWLHWGMRANRGMWHHNRSVARRHQSENPRYIRQIRIIIARSLASTIHQNVQKVRYIRQKWHHNRSVADDLGAKTFSKNAWLHWGWPSVSEIEEGSGKDQGRIKEGSSKHLQISKP